MRRIKFIIMKLLFAAAMLLLVADTYATDDPPISSMFKGNLDVVVNDPVNPHFIETIDNVFYDPALSSTIANPANDKITNVVSLYIDETMIEKIQTDFTARVTVKIEYSLLDGTTGSIDSYNLEINYTKAGGLKYNSRQTIKFDQCRKVKVTLLSIFTPVIYTWNVWQVITLENRMLRKRDYVFNYTEKLVFNNPAVISPDEFEVKWQPDPLIANGKTNIDIEWTWVDEEALENYRKADPADNNVLKYDADLIFKNNSSRITIASKGNTSYNIPLIFDGGGNLFYRIRPVQYKEDGQVINGTWTAEGFSGITYYTQLKEQGHEPGLNWQTTTSFAEDGKRKTVVQYFDGTLRGRQTVTKDNVTNYTVVAETFYDYQGRAAINILPAPTMNSVLQYTAGFNKFVGSFATPKDAFDLMPANTSVCSFATPQLDNSSGAGQYYSTNNPEKAIGFNKFIPDADGYAYTETRYTPDATGRIEAQGGVGAIFQLGKGNSTNDHDTKYFYGKPDQNELDALFGTEAGDATHYSKNMVRDANGQYSVSYTDMHGRTVATALAGTPPDNVKQLDSYPAGVQTLTKNLLSPLNNTIQDRSVVSSTSLIVTKAGPHDFHYELNPWSAAILACKPPEAAICYDCYYDLEIRISGGCGISIVKNATNLSFSNTDVPNVDQSCLTASPSIVVNFTEILPEGEYNITKTLTVSKTAQDWYRENVFNVNNICKKLKDFYDENYTIMLNGSACQITCEQCSTALGSLTQYRSAFLLQQGYSQSQVNDPAFKVPYEDEILKSYNDAKENCDDICTADTKGTLSAIRDAMLDDMIPDQGQYARLNFDLDEDGTISTGNTYNTDYGMYETNTTRPYNIFNKTLTPLRYTHPLDESGRDFYTDELGRPDPDVTAATLASLSPEDFSKMFKMSWANALIKYHPEYCKLQRAETLLKESYKRDAVMEDVDTWSKAVVDYSILGSDGTGILTNDPFFDGVGSGYKSTMQNYIKTNFNRLAIYNGTGNTATLWKLAWISVFCNDNATTTCAQNAQLKPALFPNLNDGCDGDWNQVWKIFRTLYLSEKEIMVNDWLELQCSIDYATLEANHYERRFGKPEDFYSTSDYMKTIFEEANGGGTPSVDAELDQQYDENCESYKAVWIKQLEGCDQIASHPQKAAIINEITEGLKGVCINGSDVDHPMGSSTVKPGTAVNVPQSFQQVLTTVFGNHSPVISISALCHVDIIDFPQPYDKQTPLSDETVITQKDSCVCARLTTLTAEKNADNSFPSGGTLSQYLLYKHSLTIRQTLIDSLIGGCTGTCSFWENAFVIPAIFSCNTPIKNCIECAEYNTLKAEFITKFPPLSGSVIYANPANDDQLNANKAFAKFMNNKTGFSKTWGEYLQFDITCNLTFSGKGSDAAALPTCATTFQEIYNGGKAEIANKVVYNSDGSYVVAGLSDSFGSNGYDGYLQKISKNGILQWTKTFGGTGDDLFNSIKKTADGGYILTGSTKSHGGSTNGVAWMIKTNGNGDMQWSKKYDDGNSYGSVADEVFATADGGYVMVGMNKSAPSYANAMVVKTDTNGDVQWAKSFDSGNSDATMGIVEDGNDIVIVAYQYGQNGGSFSSFANVDTSVNNFSIASRYDAVIMKLHTNNGAVVWARSYDIENRNNTPTCVFKTANGYGFNVNQDTDWSLTNPEQVIVNTDNDGLPLALNKITTNTLRIGNDYAVTSDGGYVVTQQEFNNASADINLVKLNNLGAVLWTKKYSRSGIQVASNIVQTTDGGFIMAGADNSLQSGTNTNDVYILKTDNLGNTLNCTTTSSSAMVSAPSYVLNAAFVWSAVTDIVFGTTGITAAATSRSLSANIICIDSCTVISIPSGPKLCGITSMFPEVEIVDTCNAYLPTLALNKATEQYQVYLEEKRDEFDSKYLDRCLGVKDNEVFTVNAQVAEYHYTLYYYDQAGNLVKTVPPAGVQPNFTVSFLNNVKIARQNDTELLIQHNLPTQYRYNALNQVTAQKSPDGGKSNFWYDILGRLVVSQNAKQLAQHKYSYTLYDVLGRISEVGEKNKQPGHIVMTQATAQNISNLQSWLNATVSEPNKSITKTIYDVVYSPICTQNYLCQQNLRNRVSYTYVQASDDGSTPADAPWETATFYAYDIHGNVDVLLQDYKATMGTIAGGNRYKKTTYQYDLVSGKVNEVAYQPGYADAFYHRYEYDAENKLTETYTSKDYVYWKREAAYRYYRHGPLARTVLGDPLMEIQGIDYAYTLQGWLKGVNSTALQGGGTIGSGEDCGYNTAVENLFVYNRLSPYPSKYVARNSISFMPSTFESNMPDNFEAYIDPALDGCETDGTAGDEINSPYNNGAFDMGQDGRTDGSGNPLNANNAEIYGNNIRTSDAYGYSLNYFNGDYSRIDQAAANPFAALNMSLPTGDAGTTATAKQLFNGNIGAMVLNMPKLGSAKVYGYNYDQLNRITNMFAFNGINNASNTFTPIALNDYKEAVTYDPNGNILTYKRNGVSTPLHNAPGGLNMDDLAYEYIPNSNKLKRVTDNPAYSGNYPADIDNQVDAENYVYDEIGNLIEDKAEGITGIEWNVFGKIESIHKFKNEIQTDIYYTYDVTGNRISKSVQVTLDRSLPRITNTYYVRDANGNVISMYENGKEELNGGQLTQTELYMYGNSRVGVYNVKVNVQTESRTFISMAGVTGGSAELFTFTTGNKFFELSNHLGNVLATISDKRIVYDPNNDGLAEFYKADIITANDYYPFGMQMPGRSFSNGNGYRYGFNGQEKSDEIGEGFTTAEFWEYDSRIGRRWNVDPIDFHYQSLYVCLNNNPLYFVDVNGLYGTKKEAKEMRRRALRAGYQVGDVKYYRALKTWGFAQVIIDERINNDGVVEPIVKILRFTKRTDFRQPKNNVEQGGGGASKDHRNGTGSYDFLEFLTKLNPFKSFEFYITIGYKTEVPSFVHKNTKVVVPTGVQLRVKYENGEVSGEPNIVTATQTYTNTKITEKFEIRSMPANGIGGDYNPGARLLFTIMKKPIIIVAGEVPIPIGEWKLQADGSASLLENGRIGVRFVAETFPFPTFTKDNKGLKLEITAGLRAELKVPEIFK